MRVMRLKRWQTATLIALQLLFAACATSVLVYRVRGWAPELFDFGWLSYRALNIYISLAVIGYLVWGLLRGYRHVLPLLAVFSLFHLVEGVIIAFMTKAVIHLITLIVLAWTVSDKSVRHLPGSSIARESGEIG
jgi:hypothetical protein